MILNKIKDTLLANFFQQMSSIILFLTIPKILSVENYAVVVLVGVLLTFATLADLGFSYVYSRKMPAIFHKNDVVEIAAWNATALWFGLIGSSFIGLLLAIAYYIKFQGILFAALIFLLVVIMSVTNYYNIQYTSKSNFLEYRNLTIYQSILRLFAIPLVMLFGLLGWFLNQLLIYTVCLKRLFSDGLQSISDCDTRLIKTHLIEGLLLTLTFFIWNQLIGSGRLLAAFFYEKSVIADYGLMATGYQILTSLLLAVFIPFSVSTLKMIHVDEELAIKNIFNAIYISIPCVFVLVAISEVAAPIFFSIFFKKYHYDPVIFKSFLYCLFMFPIVVTLGNVYISKQKTPLYIALLAISFLVVILAFLYLQPIYQSHAAALAQMIGVATCAILMLCVGCYVFSDIIKKKRLRLFSLLFMSLVIFTFEYLRIN